MNLSNVQCHEASSEPTPQLQIESTQKSPDNSANENERKVKVEEPIILEYHLGDDDDVIYIDVPPEIYTIQDSTGDMFDEINDSNNLNDSGNHGESLITVQTQPERQVWLKFNKTHSKPLCTTLKMYVPFIFQENQDRTSAIELINVLTGESTSNENGRKKMCVNFNS